MNHLHTFVSVSSICALAFMGCTAATDVSSNSAELEAAGGHGAPEPPMLGAHYARGGHGPPGGGGTSSPNLVYGGGKIMTNAVIQPIFWGTSWSDPGYVGDKISGLETLYDLYADSTYANTNTEYTDSTGNVTASSITVEASIVDGSPAPRRAPKTSEILAEVCAQIADPTPDGYYPVYTDTPRGHAQYCAWHSWGQCNGVDVQFGFFFDLANDPGCDVDDTANTSHSVELSSLANVTGHELSEMLTDPRGDGWVDSSGSENSDKCAWVFDERAVMSDGSTWKIQGNWSNAAYDAGTGYPNGDGDNGCLYNN